MSGDLRAKVEGLRADVLAARDLYKPNSAQWRCYENVRHAIDRTIPEGAVLVTYGEHGENDDRHHYRLECEVCGERGSVTVAIEPQYVRHLREGT